MSHECEICGQECYCDQDDCHFDYQPSNCRHFRVTGVCQVNEDGDDWDEPGEQIEEEKKR